MRLEFLRFPLENIYKKPFKVEAYISMRLYVLNKTQYAHHKIKILRHLKRVLTFPV